MIRFAENIDRQSIKHIWNLGFGDSFDFIDDFLDSYASAEGLVYEEKGVIVSMLMLLPVNYYFDGEAYPCWYAYAAATLPQFRNKGLMQKMLYAADKLAQERELHALILKPATDRLRDYYERCGFKIFSTIKTFSLKAGIPIERIEFESITINEMIEIRKNYFGNGLVAVNEEHLGIEIDMAISGGGGALKFISTTIEGYLIWEPSVKSMRIIEIAEKKNTLKANDYQIIADNIGTKFGYQDVNFLIPESKASSLDLKSSLSPCYLFSSRELFYRPENYFNFDLG